MAFGDSLQPPRDAAGQGVALADKKAVLGCCLERRIVFLPDLRSSFQDDKVFCQWRVFGRVSVRHGDGTWPPAKSWCTFFTKRVLGRRENVVCPVRVCGNLIGSPRVAFFG